MPVAEGPQSQCLREIAREFDVDSVALSFFPSQSAMDDETSIKQNKTQQKPSFFVARSMQTHLKERYTKTIHVNFLTVDGFW